jgi:hypothetical protein
LDRATPSRRARRWGAVVAVSVALLVLTGCRVDTTVTVDMASAGSGTVRVDVVLDHDAAARVPGLDRLLSVDDLRKAGWTVSAPAATHDGGMAMSATKPFGTPQQAEQILASIGGADGPLRDLTVSRHSGFASTSYQVRATVDLHAGLDAFGDPALVQALGGTSVAAAAQGLARPGDPSPASAFAFHFAATLPGGASGEGAQQHGDTATWDVPLGSAPRTLRATSSQGSPRRPALAALAVVALLAAVAVGVAGARRERRRRLQRRRRRS